MIISIFQISALILAIESAFFLSKGNLGLSAGVIAELASTTYGYNSSVLKSLADQNADSWIGVILLLTSVILQMAKILFPSQADNLYINLTSLIVTVLIYLIAFFICWRLSIIRASHLYKQAKEIIDNRQRNSEKAG